VGFYVVGILDLDFKNGCTKQFFLVAAINQPIRELRTASSGNYAGQTSVGHESNRKSSRFMIPERRDESSLIPQTRAVVFGIGFAPHGSQTALA
jgi:hypothetical protein